MSHTPGHLIFNDEYSGIVADAAPVLIWMSGLDKLCYFFNAKWLHFTGRTLQEESGFGWTLGIHPDDFHRYLNIYNASFDAHIAFNMEFRLRYHDGNYRWLFLHAVPRYAADATFVGYISSCMDISTLMEPEASGKTNIDTEALNTEQALNEELAVANEELSAANEELSSMNEELHKAYGSLTTLNEALEQKVAERTDALTKSEVATHLLNEKLTTTNEALFLINEKLLNANEQLSTAQQDLKQTIIELTETKQQIEESEKRFRSIALNIPDSLIIVVDKDHRFIIVEGDLMAKLGFDSKNYEGKHPSEVLSAERYETSKLLYDRMLTGEKFSVERKSETGDEYMIHFVPLRNDQEEVYAGLIIVLDIFEIKAAEKNSAMLAAIIESSDDAIISKTLDGIVTSWNKSAERTFGYKPEEMIGEPILKLIPKDRQDEEPQILARLRRGERVEHFETKRITKDSKILDLSLTISPVKDKQGKIIGLSKIARDISEKKQEEQRKNDFIGMVSHELKTPLTTLTLLLQILDVKLKNVSDDFIPEAMGKAHLQLRKMNAQINGFLNLSRLESAQIVLEKEMFNLNELIKETMEEAILTTSTHTIAFNTNEPANIFADRNKIGSVLSNLLGNAIKYSPGGRHLEIACITESNEVTVSIKDDGLGIAPQDIKKIFDRFYRVENNKTKFIAGFGIGLYLSAEIIRLHNGTIWAESEDGSTFYFKLPLA